MCWSAAGGSIGQITYDWRIRNRAYSCRMAQRARPSKAAKAASNDLGNDLGNDVGNDVDNDVDSDDHRLADGALHDVQIESSVMKAPILVTYASRAIADAVAESVLAAAEHRATVRVALSISRFGSMMNEGTIVLDFAAATMTRVYVSRAAVDVGNQPSTVRR